MGIKTRFFGFYSIFGQKITFWCPFLAAILKVPGSEFLTCETPEKFRIQDLVHRLSGQNKIAILTNGQKWAFWPQNDLQIWTIIDFLGGFCSKISQFWPQIWNRHEKWCCWFFWNMFFHWEKWYFTFKLHFLRLPKSCLQITDVWPILSSWPVRFSSYPLLQWS